MNSFLTDRFASPHPKRILALDGGGIRGALTLGFLKKIEQILINDRFKGNTDFRLCDYFDLIGGTSTGSIIGSALAIGMTAAQIQDQYMALGKKIFNPSGRRSMMRQFLQKKAKYDEKPLEDALENIFKDLRMDSEVITTGLCIVAKRLDTFSVWPVINNPQAKYFKDNGPILVRDMIRASSAAPTYFKPKQIEVGDKRRIATFIDGGVSAANNPALQLFLLVSLSGYRFGPLRGDSSGLATGWKKGGDDLFILSVGTGRVIKEMSAPDATKNPHMLQWAKWLPDLFMEDATYLNQTILQLLTNQHLKVEIDSEIGTMEFDRITDSDLLKYIRYNVDFDVNKLHDLGYTQMTQENAIALGEMDASENLELLVEIGEKAAEKQVEAGHISDVSYDLILKRIEHRHSLLEKPEFEHVRRWQVKA